MKCLISNVFPKSKVCRGKEKFDVKEKMDFFLKMGKRNAIKHQHTNYTFHTLFKCEQNLINSFTLMKKLLVKISEESMVTR